VIFYSIKKREEIVAKKEREERSRVLFDGRHFQILN
jgi:hypothetical protein